MVWIQRRKGAERCASKGLKRHSKGRGSGAAQRGKGIAKWCTVKRTRKRSKRGKEQHTHREKKCSRRGG